MKQLSTKGANTWNSFKQLSYSVLCSHKRGLKSQMLLKSLSTKKANMSSCRGTRVTPSIWSTKESLWLLKWINQVRNLTKSCSITQVCILENLLWWRISAHRQVSYVKLIVRWLAWIGIVLRDCSSILSSSNLFSLCLFVVFFVQLVFAFEVEAR